MDENGKTQTENLYIMAILAIVLAGSLGIAAGLMAIFPANPPPKFPAAADIPATPDTIPRTIPAVNPHHNVTEMYLHTHNADMLAFPQNLSDPYDATTCRSIPPGCMQRSRWQG